MVVYRFKIKPKDVKLHIPALTVVLWMACVLVLLTLLPWWVFHWTGLIWQWHLKECFSFTDIWNVPYWQMAPTAFSAYSACCGLQIEHYANRGGNKAVANPWNCFNPGLFLMIQFVNMIYRTVECTILGPLHQLGTPDWTQCKRRRVGSCYQPIRLH